MTDNANESGVKRTTISEELGSGKSVMYFTVGTSMKPLLYERKTHVMIAPFKGAKKHDIVLYIRDDGTHVLHRCIKVEDGFCITRGDNTYYRERVNNSQIIGTVTHIYRKGKMIDVNRSFSYRLYYLFRYWTYHPRHLVISVRRALGRFIRKLKK